MRRLSQGIAYWIRGYPVMFWLLGENNSWLPDKAAEIRRRLRAMRRKYG